MSELALKLIAQEKEEKTGSLDLGKCGLVELPEELFELTHLEKLIISDDWYDFKNSKWIGSKNQGAKNKLSGPTIDFSRLETSNTLSTTI